MNQSSAKYEMDILLKRAEAIRLGRKQRERRKISAPAVAARLFRVPTKVISAIWPNIPFGILSIVHHDGRIGTKRESTQVVLDIHAENILTSAELAKRLKVSEAWLKEKTRSRNRNQIPTLRLGRYIRFHWPDVCRWLQENSRVSQ